jgi:Ca-activated chloride channel family protein
MIIAGCWGSFSHGAVRVRVDVDKPVVLAGSDETIFVKVGLLGSGFPARHKRLPVNVAVVVDKSGSMRSDGKMVNARLGAIEVVRRLTRDDIFSLVVYDSRPRVVIPAQPVKDKEALIEIISSVGAGGSTALYDGVYVGAAEVRKHMSRKYVNRIVLLSDGLANVGPQSTGELADLGSSLGWEGITVTTIGVGLDYNEDLMTALAAASDGNSYFASMGSELPKIFGEEIGEAMTLVARQIRVRVDCSDGIRPIGIVGRDGRISGQQMAVSIGKLYGRNEKYALFEIRVPAADSGKHLDIAQVTVEFADPHTDDSMSQSQSISIAYHGDGRVVEESQNRDVVKKVALTRTSEVKKQAVSLADKGDHRGAALLLKDNAFALEKAAQQCDNDKELLGEAERCEEVSEDITSNEGLTRYYRKSIVNQAYTQINQQGYTSEEPKK